MLYGHSPSKPISVPKSKGLHWAFIGLIPIQFSFLVWSQQSHNNFPATNETPQQKLWILDEDRAGMEMESGIH